MDAIAAICDYAEAEGLDPHKVPFRDAADTLRRVVERERPEGSE